MKQRGLETKIELTQVSESAVSPIWSRLHTNHKTSNQNPGFWFDVLWILLVVLLLCFLCFLSKGTLQGLKSKTNVKVLHTQLVLKISQIV